MNPVFVTVRYRHPQAAENCGGLQSEEVSLETINARWGLSPKYDEELLSFLAIAKVGDYLSYKSGGGFIFRTR